MPTKLKIKKGDLVQVLQGKDRGKQGRVMEARPDENRVIVENLNIVKRHTRPRPVSQRSGIGGPQTRPFLLYPSTFPSPSEPTVGAAAVHGVLAGWRERLQGEARARPAPAEAPPATVLQ